MYTPFQLYRTLGDESRPPQTLTPINELILLKFENVLVLGVGTFNGLWLTKKTEDCSRLALLANFNSTVEATITSVIVLRTLRRTSSRSHTWSKAGTYFRLALPRSGALVVEMVGKYILWRNSGKERCFRRQLSAGSFSYNVSLWMRPYLPQVHIRYDSAVFRELFWNVRTNCQ